MTQLNQNLRALLLVIGGLGTSHCEKSTFGPTMVDNTSSDSAQTVSQGTIQQTTETTTTTASCAASPSRRVFYGLSTVTQLFGCDQTIASLSLSGAPTFLSANSSGTIASFTGTAPAATPSNSAWAFAINQTTTKTFPVTTVILDNSLLSSTLSAPFAFNPANGAGSTNNTEYDLGHSLTLDSSWDGAISDAAVLTTNIQTDIAGVTLSANCTTVTAPYICNGTAARNNLTIDNALKMKWMWSAFDQGPYYLDITAQAIIEGGNTTLPTKTFLANLPIQSGGNVTINTSYDTNSVNSFDGQKFRYGIAISNQSSATAPVAGVAYIATNSSSRPYFQRLLVDRTATPGGVSSGLDQGASTTEVNTANSQDFTLQALSTGDWVAVGGVQAGASNDVAFSRVSDSPTVPSLSTSLSLTSYNGTSDRAVEVTTSKPFNDGGTARIGLAFVRRNTSGSTTYNLLVAKINPTGTNSATILDDLNYGLSSTGGYSKFERSGISNQIDRLRMAWISEGGTGYFYVAHREATDLMLLKVKSSYAAGYGNSISTIGTGVFANASTSANQQSLDLALGTSSGATVAAIVYRNGNGDCYFQRADSSLVASTSLKLTNLACYNPSVHFNAASGRFIVTYAELNAGNKYDIKTTEVTIGTPDTYSTPVIVVADLAVFPVRLVTDYYPAGNWMAIFYRLINDPTLKFHGYHVSGR